MSVQWLAQVALRGLEFAVPPKELETPGEPVDTRLTTHPNRCPSPSRPKISTSGALSYIGCKDPEVLKAEDLRRAK